MPPKHSEYFCNRECEYFPCHPGADPENFNCLFCFCPLYVLGRACGGAFRVLPGGQKDCSGCIFPHKAESYQAILHRYAEILAAMDAAEEGKCAVSNPADPLHSSRERNEEP